MDVKFSTIIFSTQCFMTAELPSKDENWFINRRGGPLWPPYWGAHRGAPLHLLIGVFYFLRNLKSWSAGVSIKGWDYILKPEASSSKASRFKMEILFFSTSMIPLVFIFAKVLERVSLIVPNFEANWVLLKSSSTTLGTFPSFADFIERSIRYFAILEETSLRESSSIREANLLKKWESETIILMLSWGFLSINWIKSLFGKKRSWLSINASAKAG